MRMDEDKEKKTALIDLIENDAYFAEYIPTPEWDRFKNALIKTYNLNKEENNV